MYESKYGTNKPSWVSVSQVYVLYPCNYDNKMVFDFDFWLWRICILYSDLNASLTIWRSMYYSFHEYVQGFVFLFCFIVVVMHLYVISCSHSGLWPFWSVAVSVCGRFGLWPFRSVDFRFVAVPVCGRFGLWPSRFVAISVVAVSVCSRHDLLLNWIFNLFKHEISLSVGGIVFVLLYLMWDAAITLFSLQIWFETNDLEIWIKMHLRYKTFNIH